MHKINNLLDTKGTKATNEEKGIKNTNVLL